MLKKSLILGLTTLSFLTVSALADDDKNNMHKLEVKNVETNAMMKVYCEDGYTKIKKAKDGKNKIKFKIPQHKDCVLDVSYDNCKQTTSLNLDDDEKMYFSDLMDNCTPTTMPNSDCNYKKKKHDAYDDEHHGSSDDEHHGSNDDYDECTPMPIPPMPIPTTPPSPTPPTPMPTTPPTPTPPTPTGTMFSTDVMPVFEANCKGCHGNKGNFTVTTANGTYNNLMNNGFINTNSPSNSIILQRASGSGHGGGTILPTGSTGYNTIKAWISEGALNN